MNGMNDCCTRQECLWSLSVNVGGIILDKLRLSVDLHLKLTNLLTDSQTDRHQNGQVSGMHYE